MYLHIGTDVMVRVSQIVAILDYKGIEDVEKKNQLFVKAFMKEGEVINITEVGRENAKSLVIVNNDLIYISPISPQTLRKRCNKFTLLEGLK
jgi:extracellular matrix regulatory protein B